MQLAPLALPEGWVARSVSERDYGIDLAVELFDGSRPLGQILLVQVKGLDQSWPDRDLERSFQFPVKTLLYAEAFASPFLAVFCPTRNTSPTLGYLWLQEYLRIVLDNEKPNWRTQKTVTLRIPAENRLPTHRSRLERIAGQPARELALNQLARIHHELEFAGDMLSQAIEFEATEPAQRSVVRIESLLTDARPFAAVLAKFEGSPLAVEAVDEGLALIPSLRKVEGPQPEDLLALGLGAMADVLPEGAIGYIFRGRLFSVIWRLGAVVTEETDVELRRTMWQLEGSHLF